jgi:hypothetical protein
VDLDLDHSVTVGGPDHDPPVGRVSPIRRRRPAARWLAVAAAVAAAVVVMAVVADRNRDDHTDTASDTTERPTTTVGPVAEAAPTPASRAAADLGSFASVAELRSTLTGAGKDTSAAATATPAAGGAPGPPTDAGRTTGPTSTVATAGDCSAELGRAGATPVGTATVAGSTVAVGRLAQGGIVVLAVPDCVPR